jgi:pimeloyl-ACP methyl ester carboxylesterase
MYALSAIGPHTREPLTKALRDKASQQLVLRLLGDLGDLKAKPAINRLLDHPDFLLKSLASRTVFRLEGLAEPEEAWGERQITVERKVASLTTIIHGTWAEDEHWWRWPSDFPRYIDSITGDFYKGESPFRWSGGNTPEGRHEGSKSLIRWLKAHPAEKVTLIAHSHGGNVVFKATEIAAPGEIQIARLVLLGTPIRDDYAPNLSAIGKIHNIYSEDDIVQLLGTWTPGLENHARGDGRTLPEATENKRVRTKTDNPHSELHTVELWRRERLADILRMPVV